MQVLVTGATGFIGRHVVQAAVQAGHGVIALQRPNKPGGPDIAGVEWLAAEMVEVPRDVLARCDTIVHLAAHGVVTGLNDWAACYKTNLHDSLQLWLAAVESGVRRFVVCGSCFEYGSSGNAYQYIPTDAPLQPIGAYAASKAAATTAAIGLAQERDLAVTVFRPFHIFGAGESESRFWPSLRKAAIAGADFPMTLGEQIRDFTPVSFVAETFVRHLDEKPVYGVPRIFNVGTGTPTSLRDFAVNWWATWNARGRLLPGAIPYRANEVMRYVPKI